MQNSFWLTFLLVSLALITVGCRDYSNNTPEIETINENNNVETTTSEMEESIHQTISINEKSKSTIEPTFGPTEVGNGSIVGVIRNIAEIFSEQELTIYTANVYGETEGEGFFLLDTAQTRTATIFPDGSFEILDVKPGRYVLVVGPQPESAKTVLDNGELLIVELNQSQDLNLGTVLLSQ
jgi:hypothetical protein